MDQQAAARRVYRERFPAGFEHADGAALPVLSARRRVEPVDPQIDDRLDTINKQELVANLVLAEGRHAVHGGLAKLQVAQRTW